MHEQTCNTCKALLKSTHSRSRDNTLRVTEAASRDLQMGPQFPHDPLFLSAPNFITVFDNRQLVNLTLPWRGVIKALLDRIIFLSGIDVACQATHLSATMADTILLSLQTVSQTRTVHPNGVVAQ